MHHAHSVVKIGLTSDYLLGGQICCPPPVLIELMSLVGIIVIMATIINIKDREGRNLILELALPLYWKL